MAQGIDGHHTCTKVGKRLENWGLDCLDNCDKKEGRCSFCGEEGMCCRSDHTEDGYWSGRQFNRNFGSLDYFLVFLTLFWACLINIQALYTDIFFYWIFSGHFLKSIELPPRMQGGYGQRGRAHMHQLPVYQGYNRNRMWKDKINGQLQRGCHTTGSRSRQMEWTWKNLISQTSILLPLQLHGNCSTQLQPWCK